MTDTRVGGRTFGAWLSAAAREPDVATIRAWLDGVVGRDGLLLGSSLLTWNGCNWRKADRLLTVAKPGQRERWRAAA